LIRAESTAGVLQNDTGNGVEEFRIAVGAEWSPLLDLTRNIHTPETPEAQYYLGLWNALLDVGSWGWA